MILAHHLIIGAYGYWLPNDPRGSGSNHVYSTTLQQFGEATKVTTRQSVAGKPHDVKKRLEAKEHLHRKPVIFTGHQALSLVHGIRNYIAKSGVTIWACAIMPDHMHLVIARHTYKIECISNLLKGEMSKQLVADDRHPFSDEEYEGSMIPACFGRKSWPVFIDNEPRILNTIRYVEQNPEKAGLKRQHWNFVLPYPQRYTKPV